MQFIKKYSLYSLLGANALLITAVWLNNNLAQLNQGAASALVSLGRLAGLYLGFCALTQFLLMSRARWLETVFGLDRLSRFHRVNGHIAITCLLLHPPLITLGYALASQQSIMAQVVQFISVFDGLLSAYIGWFIFLGIGATSIYIVRRRLPYELWYYIHLSTYAAIAFAFAHQQKLGSDFLASPLFSRYWTLLYIFVFGNLLLYRVLRPIYLLKKHAFYVSQVTPANHNVTSVYIKGSHLDQFKIKAGQFVRVRFLSSRYRWQSHPFSLSCAPNPNYLRITPKAVGDFTSTIRQLKVGTPAWLDGPFGVFTETPHTRSQVLLIAGGIGITPLRSLAEVMVQRGKDVVLLYSNRTPQDIVFTKEFAGISRMGKFNAIHVISDDPTFPGEKGILDQEKIKKLVPDLTSREVFLCGPPPMMAAVVQSLQNLGLKKSLIHYEQFAL